MATWPAGLPQSFNGSGYTEDTSQENQTIRTKMDAGPDKVRLQSTAGPRLVSGAMHMTTAQLATLDTFIGTTTNGGVDQFDFPYRTGTTSSRFLKMPKYKNKGNGFWDVSFSLEVFV
jgi:hypothetical protein